MYSGITVMKGRVRGYLREESREGEGQKGWGRMERRVTGLTDALVAKEDGVVRAEKDGQMADPGQVGGGGGKEKVLGDGEDVARGDACADATRAEAGAEGRELELLAGFGRHKRGHELAGGGVKFG